MLGHLRNRSPTTCDDIHVPQNFIPGLTKPRKSIKVTDDNEHRKLDAVCYQGVQLKMRSKPKMSEKLLIKAGLIALSFPAPSQHMNCQETATNFAVKTLEPKKLPHQSRSLDYNSNDRVEKIVLSRRSTMPVVPVEQNDIEKSSVNRALSDTTKFSKDFLKVPNDSHVHIDLDRFSSISRNSSLPELDNLPEEDIDYTSTSMIEVPLSEKRRSRSFSSGLDYPPEVITSKVKRKLSLAMMKKITSPTRKESGGAFEKEQLESVQETLRSKLPKTFRVTASMGLFSTSTMYSDKRKSSNTKNQKPKTLRGGSLPFIYKSQLANDCSELSPDTQSKKWGFMKRIKTSPKLSKKSKSLDEAGISEKQKVETSMSLSLPEERSVSPFASKSDTEEGRFSPFSRAKVYSKRVTEVAIEAKSKRDSDSSDDSGIMVRNDDEDIKSGNDYSLTRQRSINSSKTIFLTPPKSEPTTTQITRKISLDNTSKCHIKLSSDDNKNKAYHKTINGTDKNKLNNQANVLIDNKSRSHLDNQGNDTNQNINTSNDRNPGHHKSSKHIVHRPSLDASFHTPLTRNVLPRVPEHTDPFINDHIARNKQNNSNNRDHGTIFDVLQPKTENIEEIQTVEELEDEISRHLKEIDEMFNLMN